jgi:cytochrome c oxidase subunit 2
MYGKQVLLNSLQTVTMDDEYIRESILNPQAKVVSGFQTNMPTFQGLVSEEQLLQLIAYVKSLSDNPSTGTTTPSPAAEPPAVKK